MNELSKQLAQSQQSQRETSNQLDDAKMKLSFNSPLADPEKLRYLRQVLFEYMMGSEGKVLCGVLSFCARVANRKLFRAWAFGSILGVCSLDQIRD